MRWLWLCMVGAAVSLGCRGGDAPGASRSEPSGAGGAVSASNGQPNPAQSVAEEAARQAKEAIDKAINPKGLPVYSGPVGTVRGVVRVSGDPPPLVPQMVGKLPEQGCNRAHELHRRLFREGPERSLGDVLVTVTNYPGFVPASEAAVRVDIKECAFDGRILAMTYGQRLEVFNRDGVAAVPRLLGTPAYALRVAMPGGTPIPLFPPKAGQYLLVDQTREFVRADVFVLNYPTFDVTGADGRFEISGIPAGDVEVTAYAPAFNAVSRQKIALTSSEARELSFVLPFSRAEYDKLMAKQPAQAPQPAP